MRRPSTEKPRAEISVNSKFGRSFSFEYSALRFREHVSNYCVSVGSETLSDISAQNRAKTYANGWRNLRTCVNDTRTTMTRVVVRAESTPLLKRGTMFLCEVLPALFVKAPDFCKVYDFLVRRRTSYGPSHLPPVSFCVDRGGGGGRGGVISPPKPIEQDCGEQDRFSIEKLTLTA